MNKLIQLKAVTVTPVEIEVGGHTVGYELREMTAAARDQYLDQLADRMRLDKDDKPCGLKKFKGHQAELLSKCLFQAADNQLVPAEEIQKWPASIVSQLFDAAQTLHALNAKDVLQEAKNA